MCVSRCLRCPYNAQCEKKHGAKTCIEHGDGRQMQRVHVPVHIRLGMGTPSPLNGGASHDKRYVQAEHVKKRIEAHAYRPIRS